jgi:hypothetical protein
MTFQKDLKLGLKYEVEILKYIKYDTYKQSTGIFKEYDIKTIKDDIITKYEIKADRIAFKTNNLCIEYEYKNKPSGIETTKADYFGYFILKNNSHDVYIIPTNNIKQSIKDKKYKKSMSGGDGKKSKFYLFDLSIFQEFLKE